MGPPGSDVTHRASKIDLASFVQSYGDPHEGDKVRHAPDLREAVENPASASGEAYRQNIIPAGVLGSLLAYVYIHFFYFCMHM